MNKITRRKFIITGMAGMGVIVSGVSQDCSTGMELINVDKVKLGNSGLQVPRLAFGTGSNGWKKESNQTRLGLDNFVEIAQYAYERGVRFLDVADIYGSHTYIREALKHFPREKVTILTKVWNSDNDWFQVKPVPETLDRFRKEIGTDYFDIVLLHCMNNGEWPREKRQYMDDLSEAKSKGIIKAVGVSCHNLDALKVAAKEPWVDVILSRINYHGDRMDGEPSEVMPVLETARKNGKGVIGMKIFGGGKLLKEEQREKSLNYVMGSGNVDCMTIGFESKAQLDDAVTRVMRIAKG